MTKNKFELEFVRKYKQLIVEEAISNAERLLKEGKLLMDHKCFSRAHHLFVTGLEEIAKANMIKDQKINNKDLQRIVSHKTKAQEIFALSAFYSSRRKPTIEERKWAGDRIPQMLEDTMYTRLKPTPGNKLKPDDNYWRKRAKSFYKLLKRSLINRYEQK